MDGGVFPSELRVRRTTILTFMAISLLLALALCVLALFLTRSITEQIEQQLTWEVASEVAAWLPQFPFATPAGSRFLSDLEAVNPNLDPYILDSSGRVLYSEKRNLMRAQVDLQPILTALQDEVPEFPLRGDDPLSTNGKQLFSVAPLAVGSDSPGYLYLLNRPPILDTLSSISGEVQFFLRIGAGFLPVILGAFLLGRGLVMGVTRNFRQIVQLLHNYQGGVAPEALEWSQRDGLALLGQEINRVAEKLAQRTRDLEARLLIRRDLLAKLVHDLRGPITGLRIAVESLSDDKQGNSTSTQKIIAAIRRSLGAHQRLMSELAPIGDLEIGPDRMVRERVSIDTLIDEVIIRESPRAQALGIRLSRDSATQDIGVLVDRSMIDRVVSNLIGNALRYTPPGGAITASVQIVADGVEIVIRDTGRGIAAADLSRIFEAFFTSDERAELKGAGVGLGLSIVKRLLELHGSTVSATSTEGVGTSFCFVLPTLETMKTMQAVIPHQNKDSEEVCDGKMTAGLTVAERNTLRICHFLLAPVLAFSAYLVPSFKPSPPVTVIISVLWCSVTLAFFGKLGSISQRLPKTLRNASVFGAAGLTWALAALFLLPDITSPPVVLWYSLLGISIGVLRYASASFLQKLLAIVPVLMAITFWMFTATRNELSILGLVAGSIAGVLLSASFHTAQSRGILSRVIAIYVVTVIVMTSTQAFHLFGIWRNSYVELDPSWRTRIAETIASSINGKLNSDNLGDPGGINFILARALSFNRRIEPYVLDEYGIVEFSGTLTDFPEPMISREVFDAVLASTLPLDLHELPSFSIRFARSPAIGLRLASANAITALVVFFESRYSDALFRKTGESFVLIFVLASLALGMASAAVIFRAVAPNLRQSVEALKNILATMEAGGDVSLAARSSRAKNFPVVQAMVSLAKTVHEKTDEFATEDRRTRAIILASVREIEFHVERLKKTTDAAFPQDAAADCEEPGRALATMNCLIRSEELAIKAVFELACIEAQRRVPELTLLDLNKIAVDASLYTVGAGELFHIYSRADVQDEIQVRSDPTILENVFCAILHGMMRMGTSGDVIRISASCQGIATRVIMAYGSPDFSSRVPGTPGETLGIAVAEAMLSHLNISLERNECGEFLTGYSFLLPSAPE